jgi:hypothetical protein
MSISAMKQALEALDAYSWEQVDAARVALRQAIEQAEKCLKEWPESKADHLIVNPEIAKVLKGSVSKREWVSLTDEEIKEIIGPWGETSIKGYTRKLFDQIEAKLKEKNHE